MSGEPIDLGPGRTLRLVPWPYAESPDAEPYGADYEHPRPDDGRGCVGFIVLDTATAREHSPSEERWTVESWSPLTLSPSLLCVSCGDHGFVRAGRWESC